MIRFIVYRTLLAVPILLGASIVVFLTMQMIPGNAVDSLLGDNATPEARADLVAEMGLDQPLIIQYFKWLGSALIGDLGRSVAHNMSALELVLDAFGNTVILSAYSALIAIVVGLLVGGFAAYTTFIPLRKLLESINVFFVSVPPYSLGLILIVYLAVGMAWFPVSGMPSQGAGFFEWMRHLALPGVTAALVPAGIIARVFQASLTDVKSLDFIDGYRARGIHRLETTWRAIYNCVPTVLTTAGLQVGFLLSGIVFVETVFSWPGIGLLINQSIASRDMVVIQAGVMICTLAFVVINLVVDIFRGMVDPRIRSQA